MTNTLEESMAKLTGILALALRGGAVEPESEGVLNRSVDKALAALNAYGSVFSTRRACMEYAVNQLIAEAHELTEDDPELKERIQEAYEHFFGEEGYVN